MDPLIEMQLRRGQDATRAYLHIGKTGGTSFLNRAQALIASQPARVPVFFPHDWTVPAIRQALPTARISLVIRDPLERVVSGFMSRERAGRPTYDSPWTTEEAISFSFFPDVRAYLRALISDRHRDKAAADFASRAIQHIRRGYRYHMPALSQADRWVGTIGRFEDIPRFACEMLGESAGLGHLHANPTSARAILNEFSATELRHLRRTFGAEYEAYKALAAYCH